MPSLKDERAGGEGPESEPVEGDSTKSNDSLQSSFTDIKQGLERLARSVGELNSKLQSTSDVLKWVLNVLSQRSEEKETLYLKNIQASTELLKSFVHFLESKFGSLEDTRPKVRDAKATKKETSTKEAHPASSKEEREFMVKPSLVRRLQEEQGKDKDQKK
jgi:prefoldin subunit 5